MLIKLVPWNAIALVGARGLIAGVTIFLYMRCRRIPFKLSKQTLLVATGVAGLFVCFVSATKLTTAANAVVIQYTGPMFFLLYCAIFRKQRFRAADYGIVIVTTLGIGMFFFGDLGGGAAIGNVVALFSGLFFTLNLVASGDADEVERLNGFFAGAASLRAYRSPLFPYNLAGIHARDRRLSPFARCVSGRRFLHLIRFGAARLPAAGMLPARNA